MLADDMGLGKTLQAIAAATWIQQHDGVSRVLIVCPTSLKHQWAREIERFTGIESQIVSGGIDQRNVQYRRPAPFHIVNYELLLRDLGVIQRELKPDLLILDEAQRIKNWRTKTAAAVKQLDTRYAFVLSGTPLENRLEDLYSLMQVVDDQVLGPLWRYQIDFHVSDERGKVIGYRNLAELRRRIAPVMLRRSRTLVADQLPERVEKLLEVPMTAEQLQAHDSALSNAQRLATIARRRPLTPTEQNQLMAALQTARMACNALGLLDGETEGSPKLDELSNLLEQHCLDSGQKMVVFSQWERMTRLAEQIAQKLGLGVLRLHGGVPGSQRGELIRRFHEDDSQQVFIATDAGATGLNLQVASVLVNLDIPWNPAILDQRIARIHRLGQRRPVFVVNMVAFEGYEARVLQLVQGKRNLFDNVVDPEAREDVVGVSRQALDSILGSLSSDARDAAGATQAIDPAAEPESAVNDGNAAMALGAPAREDAAIDPSTADPLVAAAISALQQQFGQRLEQVLGSCGGLLGILSNYRDGDEQAAADIASGLAARNSDPDTAQRPADTDPIKVSVIDRRGWQALRQLGHASPLVTAITLALPARSPNAASPLLRLAQEKLDAAEALARSGQFAASAELAAACLRAAAAQRGGLAQPPASGQLALWLYAEAVPRGCLAAEEAAAVLRAEALLQAGDIPQSLLQQLLDDARQSLALAVSGSAL
jgi:superfamily II DNA or RNA helicase